MESTRVLGVRVDCLNMAETMAAIAGMIERRDGCHLVATVNPEFVMRARADPEFAQVLESASLCVADGAYLVWAARRRGGCVRERVAGSDLVPTLAAEAAARGWRVFMLGAWPGVAADAATRLQRANPGLEVVGTHPGSPRPEDEAASLALIQAARPDLLLVAYGAPKQELWIARNRAALGEVPVAIGVGGALDFIAGRVRRAPGWMQRMNLEWLYRLIRQPWRIRRMAVLPAYALRVILDRR